MDKPQEPVTYKRKYATGDEIAFADLRRAYETAARLVTENGDQYLPVFERLEQAMQERQHKEHLKVRAEEVVRKSKTRQTSSRSKTVLK